MNETCRQGLTLTELSLVLVIIGLLFGGVLSGKSLIDTAAIRSQISQVEKYNVAVNTFRNKYNALPGDLSAQAASQFGFISGRGTFRGEGDGNGVIESSIRSSFNAPATGPGECSLFWADLSGARLIDGRFGQGVVEAYGVYGAYYAISDKAISTYLPTAKIGNDAYVYAYSGGYLDGAWYGWNGNGHHYFGIDTITQFGQTLNNNGQLAHGLRVQQAYSIDSKIDDGLPQSGAVLAQYINTYIRYAGAATSHCVPSGECWQNAVPTTSATNASSATCYDNSATGGGGVNGATQHYSTEVNGGRGMNCALSIRFR